MFKCQELKKMNIAVLISQCMSHSNPDFCVVLYRHDKLGCASTTFFVIGCVLCYCLARLCLLVPQHKYLCQDDAYRHHRDGSQTLEQSYLKLTPTVDKNMLPIPSCETCTRNRSAYTLDADKMVPSLQSTARRTCP